MSRPWERALNEQVDLIRWLQSAEGRRYAGTMLSIADEPERRAPLLAEALNHSETYWVSFDMYRLTRHAAEKLKDRSVEPSLWPGPHGFVLLETPRGFSQEEHGRIQALGDDLPALREWLAFDAFRAFSWHAFDDGVHLIWYTYAGVEPDKKGLALALHAVGSGAPRKLVPTGNTFYKWGSEHESLNFRMVVAFWLLCQQRIVRSQKTPVERHARKRAERAKVNVEDGIRVITLRREMPKPTSGAAQSVEVHWSHRWIVSEHTRNQWYPTLGMHLPITIEAYEKGPEGAPLVMKDKVYKVDR